MNKTILFLVFVASAFLSSCTNEKTAEQKENAVIESVSSADFTQVMDQGNGVLIDVRTAEEYAEGNIAGSKLIDVNGSNFNEEIQKLDKNKAVYVYCRSGARSMKAAKIMEKEGFTKIYNLEGGYLSWPK